MGWVQAWTKYLKQTKNPVKLDKTIKFDIYFCMFFICACQI